MSINVEFVRTAKEAVLPQKAHSEDACFDLYSCEQVFVLPNKNKVVDTGFRIAIPAGHVGLVCSRSGLAANRNLFVLNAPGIIDENYRGQLKVILYNAGIQPYVVDIGERIAQLFVQKVFSTSVVEVDVFLDKTTRGEGGFGSTGT